MRIGIVGAEEAKFTQLGQDRCIAEIHSIVQRGDVVVSGACHLGGVDIWAEVVAKIKKCETLIFPPKVLNWSEGYRPRNIQIAENSDYVICLAVNVLPNDFDGMQFEKCYHCNATDHVKSGGCWTLKYARKIGIPGEVRVIQN